MKHYYVAFGSSTELFVIATFKGDENGALSLRDAINSAIKQNDSNIVACCYCHVLSLMP